MPILLCLLLMMAPAALAEEMLQPPLSVEEAIRAMDRDRDGMVSAAEIRAYLEASRGKGYMRGVLEGMEARAESRSCSSPFSRSFY